MSTSTEAEEESYEQAVAAANELTAEEIAEAEEEAIKKIESEAQENVAEEMADSESTDVAVTVEVGPPGGKC